MASPNAITKVYKSTRTLRSPKEPSKAKKSKRPGLDRLTKLPSELLDQIFDEVYRSQGARGGICKALLPFQRRHYRALMAKDDSKANHLDIEHAKTLLSSAIHLECLHLHPLVDSTAPLPLLALLTKPSRLAALCILVDVDGGELEVDDEAEGEDDEEATTGFPPQITTADTSTVQAPGRSIATFLSRCTSLMSLSISGDFDYFDDTAFLPTLRHLSHLRHLNFGDEFDVSCKVLKSHVTGKKRLHHLKHLTLDMFYPEDGGYDADDCDGKPWRFQESWCPFLKMEWPGGLSHIRLASFNELATAEGVLLDGTVLEALDTWDAYEEVKAELEEYGGHGHRWD